MMTILPNIEFDQQFSGEQEPCRPLQAAISQGKRNESRRPLPPAGGSAPRPDVPRPGGGCLRGMAHLIKDFPKPYSAIESRDVPTIRMELEETRMEPAAETPWNQTFCA